MKRFFIIFFLGAFFSSVVFAQRLISLERMLYLKENVYNLENGSAARKTLISQAEKALKKDVVPITDKAKLPPSGDKHDYISMGPYWWANPDTPDGLPYIRKDGQRNPEIYQFDRYTMGDMVKAVVTLGYAYHFTDDERYADKAMEHLNTWFVNPKTRMNPNLNYGQMIPGHNEGKGRGEGVIDIYGFVEMMDCIMLLSSSKAMKANDLKTIQQWFSDLLDWLLTSEIGIDEGSRLNNHAMSYDVQITAYALFSGRMDIAEKTIDTFPAKRIFTQVEPDGSQPLELERTMAMHYTLFNIDHMLDLCFLAKSIGKDIFSTQSDDGRSVTQAIEFIRFYLGKPQSEFPYKQIRDWDEYQNNLCWTLRRAAFFVPNEEYELLFKTYCKTSATDRNWIFWGRFE